MILLALDLATTTGFAVGDVNAYRPLTQLEAASGVSSNFKLVSGSYRIAPPHTDIGPFLVRYMNWLDDMLMIHGFGMVCYEAPVVVSRAPKGKSKSGRINMMTVERILGLTTHTESWCTKKKIDIYKSNNSSVRKHFIGVGRADSATLKRLTIEACRTLGWTPRDDNEADALALYDYHWHALNDARLIAA